MRAIDQDEWVGRLKQFSSNGNVFAGGICQVLHDEFHMRSWWCLSDRHTMHDVRPTCTYLEQKRSNVKRPLALELMRDCACPPPENKNISDPRLSRYHSSQRKWQRIDGA